jgi:hypothetical protein
VAIQQIVAKKDAGRPMYGTSYGRIRCGMCQERVPYRQLMVWFKRTGWIHVVCWQNDSSLPHAYQGSE